MSKISPARLIAFDSFVEVLENKKKPDDVLDSLYRDFKGDIKRIDKNLAKEILFGGLRWYKKIFWILQHTANRDLTKLSPQVRAALILGTYQIYYMDRIPERAAVNEAAEYMKEKRMYKSAAIQLEGKTPLLYAIYYNMGLAYKKLDDQKNAAICFRRSLKLNNEFDKAKHALAELGEKAA